MCHPRHERRSILPPVRRKRELVRGADNAPTRRLVVQVLPHLALQVGHPVKHDNVHAVLKQTAVRGHVRRRAVAEQ